MRIVTVISSLKSIGWPDLYTSLGSSQYRASGSFTCWFTSIRFIRSDIQISRKVPVGTSTKYEHGVSAVEVTVHGTCLLSVVTQTFVSSGRKGNARVLCQRS